MTIVKNMDLMLTDKLIVLIGLLGLFFSTYMQWSGHIGVNDTTNKNPVGTIEIVGVTQRRQSKTLFWEVLKGTQPVYWLDTLYVPVGSTAELKIQGNSFTLQAGTMLQLDKLIRDQIEITLLEGTLDAKETTKKARVNGRPLLTKEKATIRLPEKIEPLPKIEFTPPVVSDPLQSERVALSQSLATYFNNKKKRAELQKIEFTKTKLDRLQHYELEVVSPKSGVQVFDTDGPLVFRWKRIPLTGIKYKLEIYRSNLLFKTLESEVPSIETKIPLGFYTWKLTATRNHEDPSIKEGNFTFLRAGQDDDGLKTEDIDKEE